MFVLFIFSVIVQEVSVHCIVFSNNHSLFALVA
jgi:hypothetical protein